MFKNILIILIFIGIIFIIVDLVRTEKVCPQNKIIYRSNRQLDGLSPKQIANIPPHLSDVGCINTPFFESESNEHIL